jgi:flavodoxin
MNQLPVLSKTGTTKKYADEIARYLTGKGLEASINPIKSYSKELLNGADYVFFGCWTSGLFLFLQQPHKKWVEFAKKLQRDGKAKHALFTTYRRNRKSREDQTRVF